MAAVNDFRRRLIGEVVTFDFSYQKQIHVFLVEL